MTRVPITSPLAVLTTRTTQEHLMATHSTTDLKPGDIVQHPEHGYGVVLKNFPGVPTIYFAGKHGYENTTRGFTGWERVETVRPGHVQVRVDDIGEDGEDLSDWLNADEDSWGLSGRLAIRVAKALAAQRTESTPPADEQEADFAIGWLNCPWCSESFTIAPRLARDAGGHVRNVGLSIVHTCPPAQPEEPTEFGARIIVTDDLSGKAERWCRQHDGYWASENGALMTWAYLTQRGAVTLGWETLGWDE